MLIDYFIYFSCGDVLYARLNDFKHISIITTFKNKSKS